MPITIAEGPEPIVLRILLRRSHSAKGPVLITLFVDFYAAGFFASFAGARPWSSVRHMNKFVVTCKFIHHKSSAAGEWPCFSIFSISASSPSMKLAALIFLEGCIVVTVRCSPTQSA